MLSTSTILQNRYRIVSLLGQGGMGAVYRAWDTRLKVSVALKEMIPQPGLAPHTLTQLRQQFEQEATVLARLNHPHLVRVSDYFEVADNAYLVMEFVEGESLFDRIKREGALPEADVLAWADQLLDALGYCHSQRVIHRDVKPHNIVIRPDGQVVLVDFGLVKLWDPNDPRTRTVMQGMGTPEYAPPEQYGTQPGHTDPRSDLYSLGATLFHALTGQPPLTAADRMADPDRFVPLRGVNPRVSSQTEAVVLKAMALARVQRWQSAAEMRATLTRQKRKPPPLSMATVPTRKARFPAWAWALGGLAVLAMVVWIVTIVGGGVTPTLTPRDSATPTLGLIPAEPKMATSTCTPTPGDVSASVPMPTLVSLATPTRLLPDLASTPAPANSPELTLVDSQVTVKQDGSLDIRYRLTFHEVDSRDRINTLGPLDSAHKILDAHIEHDGQQTNLHLSSKGSGFYTVPFGLDTRPGNDYTVHIHYEVPSGLDKTVVDGVSYCILNWSPVQWNLPIEEQVVRYLLPYELPAEVKEVEQVTDELVEQSRIIANETTIKAFDRWVYYPTPDETTGKVWLSIYISKQNVPSEYHFLTQVFFPEEWVSNRTSSLNLIVLGTKQPSEGFQSFGLCLPSNRRKVLDVC